MIYNKIHLRCAIKVLTLTVNYILWTWQSFKKRKKKRVCMSWLAELRQLMWCQAMLRDVTEEDTSRDGEDGGEGGGVTLPIFSFFLFSPSSKGGECRAV